MKTVAHLTANSKFVIKYIKFMIEEIPEINHTFIISNSENLCAENDEIESANIVSYTSKRDLISRKDINSILSSSDKIILSGFFDFEKVLVAWPKKYRDKLYIQFWGGDFYDYVSPAKSFGHKQFLTNHLQKYIFKNAKGHIFLISGEAEEFRRITNVDMSNTFIAPMPWDPQSIYPWKSAQSNSFGKPIKILIGNSASESNKHIDAFEKLAHLKNSDIEIYCPLSYGDSDYADLVISKGKEIFGDKFIPVLNWMNGYEYNHFLSSFDIGVFNNNRQQALGNIYRLLLLGKKLYMQPNTTMFKHISDEGFKLFDINSISNCSFDTLANYSERDLNICTANNWLANYNKVSRGQWLEILND